MATPPPYSAPKSGNKTGLIIGLVIGAALLCCVLPIGLMVGGGMWAMTKGGSFITCSLAYNMVPTAINDYATANGGKLPNAATWMDDVRPYYKKRIESMGEDAGPFKVMDADSVWGCTEGEKKTGMSYNAALSGKTLDSIEDKSNTVLVFETPTQSKNLAGKYVAPKFEDSPGLMGMNQKRGWYVATVDGTAALVDKTGNRAKVDTTGNSSGSSTKMGPLEIKSDQ